MPNHELFELPLADCILHCSQDLAMTGLMKDAAKRLYNYFVKQGKEVPVWSSLPQNAHRYITTTDCSTIGTK